MTGSWEAQIAENARKYQALNERISQLSITESSGDGTVRVTVSASGLLTELQLKDKWNPVPAAEVAAQIMDCVRRAQARIPELLRQAMFDTIGPDDPSAHLLLDDARRRFPEPPPPETPRSRGEPPPPPPRAARATEQDDWDERAVMEDI